MRANNLKMNNLKKILELKGITHTALSVDLGISREAVSKYISGSIKPKITNIIELSKILSTTTDYLLDLTDNPNPTDFYLDEYENTLINNYRLLNEKEKEMVLSYIKGIIDVKNLGK